MLVGSCRKNTTGSSQGDSSTISAHSMNLILERLKANSCRKSTNQSYLGTWRRFNQFLLKLDWKPPSWEERVSLFVAYLVDKGIQSATVKSYVSAIKKTLITDGYQWDDTKILLSTLTGACKLINDRVFTRLPIQIGLLELLLFEINRKFIGQRYIICLYQALFAIAYYGLFRIDELCETGRADHSIKVINVHVATNKNKILIILPTSKTHGKGDQPQKIKITANDDTSSCLSRSRHFCPFNLMQKYIEIRGGYDTPDDQFFVLSDKSPLKADSVRSVLKELVTRVGLEPKFYSVHSIRAGRASDLAKFHYSVDEIRRCGRWSSNTVYRYIKL